MARPHKNNADYFSHDADMRNDPKIKALRRKFGIEGYGIYCMLIEVLTDAEYFTITIDEIGLELISGDFDTAPERLKEVIDYCVTIGLFQTDNSFLRCKTLENRFEALLSKRKQDRNGVIGLDNTHSKAKDSIAQQTKEENNINEGREVLIFGDKNKNPHFIAVKAKYIHDKHALIYGVSGLTDYLESAYPPSKLTFPEHAEKFMRAKDGHHFEDLAHLKNAYDLYVKNKYK